jgi:hypothetical protein
LLEGAILALAQRFDALDSKPAPGAPADIAGALLDGGLSRDRR